MFEVLEVIAESAPHIFLHNGVSLQDAKLMARVLYKTLLQSNKGNLIFLYFFFEADVNFFRCS